MDDRKYTYEKYFSLGLGLISWSSKKKTIVSLSYIEVKYIAIRRASAQVLWLSNLLKEHNEK